MANAKEYRALTDLDWVDSDGNEHHTASGDKMTDPPDNVVKSETAAGNLEEWVAKQTENIKDHAASTYLIGVKEDSHGVLQVWEEGTKVTDNG